MINIREQTKGFDMVNGYRVTQNQATILASAVITSNRNQSGCKPVATTIGHRPTKITPMVISLIVRVKTILTTEFNISLARLPRLCMKLFVTLRANKSDWFYPFRVGATTHLFRSKGVGRALTLAKLVADLVFAARLVLTENTSTFTGTTTKPRAVSLIGLDLKWFMAPLTNQIYADFSSGIDPTGDTTKPRCGCFSAFAGERFTAYRALFFYHDYIIPQISGSGTTLRAAKNLKRRCVGIERDLHYCEVTVKRLEPVFEAALVDTTTDFSDLPMFAQLESEAA